MSDVRNDLQEARAEIGMLADVLMREFGGPQADEGEPCEMAIRIMREQRATIDRMRATIEALRDRTR